MDVNTTASEETNDSRSDAPEVASSSSTLDAVRRMKGAVAPTTDEKPQPVAASKDDAPNGESKGKKADNQREEAEPEGGWLSDSELVGKDLRNVDLKRVNPVYRQTVANLQRAERKKHETLDALIADAKGKATPEPAETTTDDDDDDPYLDDVRSALKTKKGKALIRELLREEGLDLAEAKEVVKETAEDRLLTRVLNAAAETYDEIAKDQTFFHETVQHIANDEDLSGEWDDAEKRRDQKALTRIFKAAAREVRADRKESERQRADKAKKDEKATRDQETLGSPGSRAAKAGRKTPVPDGPMTTLERVKQVREQLASG